MSGMMPEWHSEEHIQAAQSFCMSHGADIMPECFKVMIYMISNGMTMHSAAKWDIFTSLLRTEMVGLTVNLQKLRNESPTIRAFSDNLFRNEIRLATEPYDIRLTTEPYHRRARDTENPLDRPLDLIQWLLESGQDPNTCLEARNENGPVTPIGHAIRAGHENIFHLLLQFDACINENQANRDGQTVIDLALEYPGSTATQLRIVKVLSGHYHPPDPHELLCAAIELRDIEFAKELLHCDIDITKTRNPLRNHRSRMGIESYYIEIRSPLAMAMIKGGGFADLLLTQFLLKDGSDIYIASDVFIAAACGGDLSIMLRLYDLQPFGTTCDCKGVTPLQAAVASGILAICEFLLERHGGASTALLLAAAIQNHADVLPLLIRYRACPRDLVQQDDISWLKFFVEIGSGVDETPRSILRMMFDLGLWDEWPIDCLSILIHSGALVDGDVARLAERWWDKSVADALDAGGNPNDRDHNGRTALQCALEEDHPPGQGKSERLLTVEILLKAGAKLNGAEVVKAIQSKDVELLMVLLRHGGSLTDVDEIGVSCLEAEITARNDESLQQLLGAQEGQIHAGPFCAAIQDQDWALVERLFAHRHMQEGSHLLEGAAIGLAARFGRLDVLGKLLSRFTHPNYYYIKQQAGSRLNMVVITKLLAGSFVVKVPEVFPVPDSKPSRFGWYFSRWVQKRKAPVTRPGPYDTCHTDLGTKSVKSLPTETKTDFKSVAIYKRVITYDHVYVEIFPSTFTLSDTITDTLIHTAEGNPRIATKTVFEPTTITSTQTFTHTNKRTITTTVTERVTWTVRKVHGFTAIDDDMKKPKYKKKKRPRKIYRSTIPLYYQRVWCTKEVLLNRTKSQTFIFEAGRITMDLPAIKTTKLFNTSIVLTEYPSKPPTTVTTTLRPVTTRYTNTMEVIQPFALAPWEARIQTTLSRQGEEEEDKIKELAKAE
ncbi:uncharacterized protein FRV6_02763 [Fusarium oxysporum]|uniref:Uncharacterized protein n=1 Tax=Fusarium oxysporum TaxID=5507 RepID=A0A2H3T6G9_FUSOX|nr:uncharacterized protein FRV6_02763 [Fusarium oxysporum]